MYQKILNWSEKNGDKLLHLIAGMKICLASAIILPLWAVLIPVVVVGLAKEVWDMVSYGLFSISDLLYTVCGGVFVYFCLFLIL